MPIRIPDTLPAFETLVHEGVRVMTETMAIRQDIRPLQIGLLNLMPNKIKTEVQFARLIGASPLQVEQLDCALGHFAGHLNQTQAGGIVIGLHNSAAAVLVVERSFLGIDLEVEN